MIEMKWNIKKNGGAWEGFCEFLGVSVRNEDRVKMVRLMEEEIEKRIPRNFELSEIA